MRKLRISSTALIFLALQPLPTPLSHRLILAQSPLCAHGQCIGRYEGKTKRANTQADKGSKVKDHTHLLQPFLWFNPSPGLNFWQLIATPQVHVSIANDSGARLEATRELLQNAPLLL